MSISKKKLEDAATQFQAILARKALPSEERWTDADRIMAKALIANGYDHACLMRDNAKDNIFFVKVYSINTPKPWALFLEGSIFPDMLRFESLELKEIADMIRERTPEKE